MLENAVEAVGTFDATMDHLFVVKEAAFGFLTEKMTWKMLRCLGRMIAQFEIVEKRFNYISSVPTISLSHRIFFT